MKMTHIPFKNHKLASAMALAVASWGGIAAPASAGEAKFALEEIVVTAQRREESLQDVPMSVTAITESFLQDSRIDHVADVVDYTPGLTGAAAGVLTQKYAIRGISSSQDVGISGSSSVGVFSDGSYLGKELAALAFIDTAQVEVLKGPQGSLFGRNTSAGAINITTNKPNADPSLSVGQSIGRYGSDNYSYKTTVVANQPLIEDTLFVRASLLREDDDAYINNEFLDREVGGNEGLSGRVRLKYLPSSDLEIELDLMSADRRTLGTPTEIEAGNSLLSLADGARLALDNGLDYGIDVLGLPHSLSPEFTAAFAPASGLTPDLFDSKLARDTRSKEVLRANVAGFDIKWDFNEYNTLTLRTSYGETSAASLSDIDATPINLLTLDIEGGGREFTQNIRLNGSSDRWTWLAGAIYYRTHSWQKSNAIYDDAALFLSRGTLPLEDTGVVVCDATFAAVFGECGTATESGWAQSDTEAWAVYGDVTYEFNDRVSLTAGLRYSYEDKSIQVEAAEANNAYNLYGRTAFALTNPGEVWEQAYGAPTSDELKDKTAFSAWSPRFTARYQWRDDVMFFASVATGHKAGGFDPAPENGSSEKFDEEKNKSYELGVKSSWFDNRLMLNGAVYYSDYEGLQVEVNENGKSRTRNIPTVISQGIELDAVARPTESLDIIATYSYNDTEFGAFRFVDGGVPVDWTDNELPLAPQQTASLIAQYTVDFNDALDLVVRGESIYSSDYYYTLRNARSEHQDGFTKFNMRVTLADKAEVWSVSLFGENLGDKEHTISRENVLGTGSISVRGEPRFWGLEFSYNL